MSVQSHTELIPEVNFKDMIEGAHVAFTRSASRLMLGRVVRRRPSHHPVFDIISVQPEALPHSEYGGGVQDISKFELQIGGATLSLLTQKPLEGLEPYISLPSYELEQQQEASAEQPIIAEPAQTERLF